MSHRTLRIVLCDLAEGGLGRVEGEGMEERDSFFELFLHPRIAGYREVDCAELLLGQHIVLVLSVEDAGQRDK